MGFVSWEDIANARPPVLGGLAERGGVGLMTTVAGRPNTVSGAYLTLGTGARVAAPGVRIAPVREVGLSPALPAVQGASAAQFDRMSLLRDLNRPLHYTVPLGLLGDALAQAGLLAAAVGNADADDSGRRPVLRREAATIVMDKRGYVPLAFIGSGLVERERGTYVTNQKALAQAFRQAVECSALVVVDLGDTSRAHRRMASPEASRAALLRADATLERLLASVRWERSRVIVLSPWARRASQQPLAPIIVAGEGVPRGYLSSPSTRREALVCSVEVAPSVLAYLGLPVPPGLTGRAMTFIEDASPERAALLARRNRIYGQLLAGRTPAGVVLSVLESVGMVLGLAYLWWRRGQAGTVLGRWALMPLILPATWLTAMVVGPLMQPGEAAPWSRLAVAGGLALAVVVLYATTRLSARWLVVGCAALTCAVLVVDQWLGGFVASHSLLGYSPVVAGRFYGLGNELMSVLTGAALLALGLSCKAECWPRWEGRLATGAAIVVGVFTVGMPFWGANFGGTLTVATGLWTLWMLMTMSTPTVRRALVLLGAVLASVVICVAADLAMPKAVQTHIGRAVGLVSSAGLAQLKEIVLRKAEGNVRIFMFTRWSLLFVVIFPFLVYSLLKPIRVLSELFRGLPALGALTKAAVYAAVVGMAFNDSGIAVPSIILGMVVPASIAVALEGVAQSAGQRQGAANSP